MLITVVVINAFPGKRGLARSGSRDFPDFAMTLKAIDRRA
jgi:hypothetical protein